LSEWPFFLCIYFVVRRCAIPYLLSSVIIDAVCYGGQLLGFLVIGGFGCQVCLGYGFTNPYHLKGLVLGMFIGHGSV